MRDAAPAGGGRERRRTMRLAALAAAAIVAISGLGRPAAAQPAVTATSGSPAAIARIRREFAEIEREARTYRRTRHYLYGFSLEGGELQGFFRGGELRKLRAALYGETWRGTHEYYFSGGRLVFIYTAEERYEGTFGPVRWRIENRYYFSGGRLIRHVRTQRPADGEDTTVYDPGLQVLLDNAELFAACTRAPAGTECTAPERDQGGT